VDCAAGGPVLESTNAGRAPRALEKVVPQVHFTSNLQRHVSCPSVTVPGDTVAAALGAVFDENPALRSYLLDDQGRLRRHVNVFVNGSPVQDRTRLSDALDGNDEVFVIQALSGG
jgi:molybdopterin synthase sulfur carrier subunit